MSAQTRTTPKDVFLQILAIAMLYVTLISFVLLVFTYIDVRFPDSLEPVYKSAVFGQVRSSMSSLFIAWPVYVVLMWAIRREEHNEPAKKELGVKKALVYLTLFIASVTMIIDVITLLNRFLGGELSIRFSLKALTVLIAAFTVCSLYLWDLRRGTKLLNDKIVRLYAVSVSAVLFLTIVCGFFVLGSPAEQRRIRFDEQRISDLQQIQNQLVFGYWQQKGSLPEQLDAIRDDIVGFSVPLDPDTREAYGYSKKGDRIFELCAVFGTKQNSDIPLYHSRPEPVISQKGIADSWAHESGRVCFERTIDPALYPTKDKNIIE